MVGAKCCWDRRACASKSGANRGGSRRSNQGPIAWFIASTFPQGTIYVKHFLVPDWRATLRQWVRRGKGRNEGKRSQHLASIGVPTITPIALGERRKRKFLFENYLVTLAISSAIPLDEFVERHLPGAARADPFADPPKTRRGHGRHDGPAARCGPAPPGLSSRQHHGSAHGRQCARTLHDRSRRAAQEPPRDLEAGPPKPGAPRPLTSGCAAVGPTVIVS